MIALSWLATLSVHASTYETSFDSSNYEVQKSIDGMEGWKIHSGEEEGVEAIVTNNKSFVGTQSLRMAPGTMVERAVLKGSVRYYDLELLPKFAEGDAATRLNFLGGVLSFETQGSSGKIVAYSGAQDVGVVVRSELPLGDGSEDAWLRITVRVDLEKKVWDLFLEGKPVKAGLALGDTKPGVQFAASSLGPVFLDDYFESSENPLFEDADNDGMPDAEELVFGLNPGIDDRNADLDGDGSSNVDEFFAGTMSGVEGLRESSVLFVDNLSGDDANSGKSSQIGLGTEGPKASIRAAMAAAADGATIVVLKGKGVYEEGSRSSEGKKLTIKTAAPVTIR